MIPALLLSPKLWIVAGISVASFLSGMSVHKMFTDRKVAALELRHAEAISNWERQVAAAHAEARNKERQLQSQVDSARTEANDAIRTAQDLDSKVADTNRQLAAARTDAAGLRNQVRAYSAARGSEDSISACNARAGRLGEALADCGSLLSEGAGLLSEGADLVRASARAADVRGGKLAACLKGWPK
jgi:chromosome segregation ATPase